MTHLKQWFLFTLVLLGLIPQIVVLGSMPYMPFDALWDNADFAVLGNVTSIQLSIVGGFYRIVEIDVEASFFNQWNVSTVKIRVEGGEFGGLGVWVEDQPEFEVGERVFVFLNTPEAIKGDYEYVVYLMFQGKFSVNGSTAFQETGRTFEIPVLLGPEIDDVKPYTGIEFQQILIVVLGVVLLSITIVWLLTPS